MPVISIHTPPSPLLSVSDLFNDFNQLLSLGDKKSSVVIEKQKLAIMEQVAAKLKYDAPPVFSRVEATEEEDTTFKKKLKGALYSLLLVFGVLEDAANAFFFGSALFSLIPAITNNALFIASVTYAGIESLLFYLYDAAELKNSLGITDPHTKLSPLIALHSQQIKIATELNQSLAMISSLNMTREQYDQYEKFVLLLNDDLKKKYALLNKTHDSWFKKALQFCVSAFGAISSLAGSYFMATTVMIFCCPMMIATPIGAAIILATMVIGIVFHYAMDTTSMTRIVNPDYEKYQTLKKDMREFNEMYSENLLPLQLLRHKFEKKKMVDNSTQTTGQSTAQIAENCKPPRAQVEGVVYKEGDNVSQRPLIKHSMFAPTNTALIDVGEKEISQQVATL